MAIDIVEPLINLGLDYARSKFLPAAYTPGIIPPAGFPSTQPIQTTPAFLDVPGIDIVSDPGDLVAKALKVGGQLIYNYMTGKWQIRRRRRRRRLLTPTDLADLAQLQVLVGKGSQSMSFAVMKAVRR